MKVDGTHYRSIWFNEVTNDVGIIDQRWLPSEFRVATLKTHNQFATAIGECVGPRRATDWSHGGLRGGYVESGLR